MDEERKGPRVLREWGFDLEMFQARAKQSIDAARGDLGEVTGTLRQALSDTKQVLIDLQRTKGPVSTELKGGFERAWDEIEKAFHRARQYMRESRPEPDTTTASTAPATAEAAAATSSEEKNPEPIDSVS
jgi:hypothetical protein